MHAQAVLTLTPAASAIRFSLPFALRALSARVHCYNVVALGSRRRWRALLLWQCVNCTCQSPGGARAPLYPLL
jgi:hypothetical protein